ncbi:branched-chain amino acid ABC transporter permease [Nakamurella leprariae]|uniref:Branched-chain amino acid ABC transporter permease n=1 Tax=Nakamurella leprariae TaxID=2803911 RepID=A0A939C236_9ACTN|nr:branched-chain amino acid ABC transporter permease [Nakamurella leprariae]MBM9467814.1 branched-chain amino acid ABC transporter permease [Nakamurella leprariae]
MRRLRQPRPRLPIPRWVNLVVGIAAFAYLLYAPLVSPSYSNTQMAMVCVYAVAGLGLHLLTGMTGLISLGHGFFFAVGAYTAAILSGTQGWPVPVSFVVAAALGWLLGFLFGLPALRLSPLALSQVTLALALITPSLIKRLDFMTNGSAGLSVDVGDPPAWSGLDKDQWILYICLLIALVAYLVTLALSRGRTGRAMKGLRDNLPVATTLGVRATTTKSFVFATSAAFAAVGGVLYTLVIQYVGADAFGLTFAIALITVIVVGGLGSVPGVILGAVFVVFVPSWASEVSPSASGLIYGVALVVFMFVLPGGVIGVLRAIGHPVVSRFHARRSTAQPPVPQEQEAGRR